MLSYGQASEEEHFKWKLVTSWPRAYLILHENLEKFAFDIQKMTGGKLVIDVFPAGEYENIKAFDVFDAVSQGKVEMGHSAAYYWSEKVSGCEFMCSVPFGMTPGGTFAWLYHGEGLQLWKELYEPFNLVPFPMGNTGIQMGGWFNKKIEKISDFSGLRMRIPGLGGEVLKKAGLIPFVTPSGEVYNALERGDIDAAEVVGPYHDKHLRLYRVAKYYYYPAWHEPGTTHELIINKKAWEKLPPEIQKIIEVTARSFNLRIWAEYEAQNQRALEELRDDWKVEIIPFPDDVIDQLRKFTDQVLEEKCGNPQFKKAHDSYKEFKKYYSDWNYVSYDAYKSGLTPSVIVINVKEKLSKELSASENVIIRQEEDNSITVLIKGDSNFGISSAIPTKHLSTEIGRISQIISMYSKSVKSIKIEGHTDNIGDDLINMKLSLKRAEAVKELLRQKGVESNLLKAVPKGESIPIDDNNTVEGRKKNRRVEIRIYY